MINYTVLCAYDVVKDAWAELKVGASLDGHRRRVDVIAGVVEVLFNVKDGICKRRMPLLNGKCIKAL